MGQECDCEDWGLMREGEEMLLDLDLDLLTIDGT